MYSISLCEPLSCLLPPVANTTPSFLVPVLVHTPGLWCHQVSHPLTMSCGTHERHGLPGKITGNGRTLAVNHGVCWLLKEKW
jgi:hypothetical protein